MGHIYGESWSMEDIERCVLQVKSALRLDRMPSRSECEQYFHNTALTNAVSRHGGWYALAKHLGLEIKKSETGFGKIWEQSIADMLTSKGHTVQRMPQNFPYDLLVDQCVKVDVKASHLYRGKIGDFYTFNLEKPYATCDAYVLVAVQDDDTLGAIYIIPSVSVINNTQISIGKNHSVYQSFIERWDIIKAISQYWGNIRDANPRKGGEP